MRKYDDTQLWLRFHSGLSTIGGLGWGLGKIENCVKSLGQVVLRMVPADAGLDPAKWFDAKVALERLTGRHYDYSVRIISHGL